MEALDAVKIESALAAEAERKEGADETGQGDFLQMLVAQLQNQDPLNPQDSADFAAQLAQFSTVEQLIGVREGVDALVANAGLGGEGAAAARIDPTNLVGKDVVVYGSQIEVGPDQQPITMPFRTIEAARSAEVRIINANGDTVHEDSLLTPSESGEVAQLLPGDHEYTFDPYLHNQPPGLYAIEFVATDENGRDVGILPMVEGTVTGAILAGEPSIRIGERVFLVDDVLEVKVGSPEEESRGDGDERRRLAWVLAPRPRGGHESARLCRGLEGRTRGG